MVLLNLGLRSLATFAAIMGLLPQMIIGIEDMLVGVL